MRELLAGLVPGLPASAAKSIIARADGIPLYAVETVRMLLAEGKLALNDEVYVPVGDLTSLAVPETLTALIAARLDGLPAEERTLILDAAVLGQSFTPAALAAVSGQDEAAIEPRMQALVKRELLTVGSDPRSPERGQYAFVQALIREVAYGMLARRDRKTRHLAAARFFESLGSDELAGALAGHYLAAYQNAPEGPEAEALAGQARIALRSAADRAISLGAHAQAVKFLDQAIGVTRAESEQAELRLAAASSAVSAVDWEVADGYFIEVADWARANGDWSKVATALTGQGLLLVNRSFVEQAIVLIRAALDEVGDKVGDRELGALHAQLARALSLHEETAEAVMAADIALTHAGRARDAEVIAETLISKATALAGLGRLYESVALNWGAINMAERMGFARTDLRARNNLSGFLAIDDPQEAHAMLLVGLERARRLGEPGWFSALTTIDGLITFWIGDWDTALAEIDEAVGASGVVLAGMLALVSSWIQAARGDLQDAREAMVEAQRQTEGTTNPTAEAYARMYSPAWLALCEGRFGDAASDAYACVLATWEILEEGTVVGAAAAALDGDLAALERIAAEFVKVTASGLHFEAINAELEAYRLALAGELAEAGQRFAAGAGLLRRLGYEVELALFAIVRATLLQPLDAPTMAAVAEAREILGRLGAEALLKLLDDAVAGRGSPAETGPRGAARPKTQSNVSSGNR